MACTKGLNLNKNNTEVCGGKGGKCDFLYTYSIDKCTVSNKSTHLELTGCGGKNSIVVYGGGSLSIGSGNMRVFTPAIHNVTGSKNIVAEIVIHYIKPDKGNLFVCIPVKQDDTSSLNDFWNFLDTVKPKGDSTRVDINIPGFTLNKVVTNCPFFRYTGKNPIKLDGKCDKLGPLNDAGEVLVWDSNDGNISTISSSYKTKLYGLINKQAFNYPNSPDALLYNKYGASKPGDNPESGKVQILSSCTQVTRPNPSDNKTKKTDMANWIWIAPLILLGVFTLITLFSFLYRWFDVAWLRQAGGTVNDNRGITVLVTLLVLIVTCIIILFIRQGGK